MTSQPEEKIGSMNSPEINPTGLNQRDKASVGDLETPRTAIELFEELDALTRFDGESFDRNGARLLDYHRLRDEACESSLPHAIRQLERELAEARREIADLRAQVRELATGEKI